ncbi:MAG: hypothetical protein BWY47_01522 [Bacteroidetes bacterium ADurb.Bin302]|nr:MAG: hypothetical protein BWY47_01522 [Bacteroidetes bacterium ADurb.Bin302]
MSESVKEVRKLRKHNYDEMETVDVYLSEDKTPVAFARKLKELLEQKAFNSEDEAKNWIRKTPFSMELYYSIDQGLFLVESEAVESDSEIYNPYTGEELDESIDE